MRKNLNRTLGVLSLTALLAACSQQAPTAVTPSPVQATPAAEIARIGNVSYVKNEVVVGYESEAGLRAAAAALNGTVVRTIPEINTALIRVSGDALKATGAVADLDGVRYASINTVVTLRTPRLRCSRPVASLRRLLRLSRSSTNCPSTRLTPAPECQGRLGQGLDRQGCCGGRH
ncbi:hypothetical protein ACFSC4_11805 [Deinococcus malanensis]|uniref:S8 family serine peptidase n=1 Tax=Deinococcus malanensis TaxID=1706855 RepID=UPI00363A424C